IAGHVANCSRKRIRGVLRGRPLGDAVAIERYLVIRICLRRGRRRICASTHATGYYVDSGYRNISAAGPNYHVTFDRPVWRTGIGGSISRRGVEVRQRILCINVQRRGEESGVTCLTTQLRAARRIEQEGEHRLGERRVQII